MSAWRKAASLSMVVIICHKLMLDDISVLWWSQCC